MDMLEDVNTGIAWTLRMVGSWLTCGSNHPSSLVGVAVAALVVALHSSSAPSPSHIGTTRLHIHQRPGF